MLHTPADAGDFARASQPGELNSVLSSRRTQISRLTKDSPAEPQQHATVPSDWYAYQDTGV